MGAKKQHKVGMSLKNKVAFEKHFPVDTLVPADFKGIPSSGILDAKSNQSIANFKGSVHSNQGLTGSAQNQVLSKMSQFQKLSSVAN